MIPVGATRGLAKKNSLKGISEEWNVDRSFEKQVFGSQGNHV